MGLDLRLFMGVMYLFVYINQETHDYIFIPQKAFERETIAVSMVMKWK